MKVIVVDLEMNPIARAYQEERKICRMEIIEIGAVVLDDSYHEIGSFKTLVKPQYNTGIGSTYEKLTGISTAMVQDAPLFADALSMFVSWCQSFRDEVCIYQWSESDMAQVRAEMKLKKIPITEQNQDFLTDWYDFQREYNKALGLENSVSLENALMYAGLDFEGQQHDALFDARNTAALIEVVRTPELYDHALKKVAEFLHPGPVVNTSLGDLFQKLGIVLN